MKNKMLLPLASFLIVAMVVLPVFAPSAQKIAFRNTGTRIDKTIAGSGGFVIFNQPKGNVVLVIQGKVSDLAPKTTYHVYLHGLYPEYTGPCPHIGWGWLEIAQITTSGSGNGAFHLNILASELPSGTYNIIVSIDEPGYITVLTIDPVTVTV